MASQGHFFSSCFQTPKTQEEQEEEIASYKRYKDLMLSLPLEPGPVPCYHYRGFWFNDAIFQGLMAFREGFTSRSGDILLTTYPKSGTTWLKALAFATLHRKDHHSFADHPLLRRHPQDCAPYLEELFTMGQFPDLDVLPTPRLLGTHTPYSLLPDSITASDDCRVVYLCRDPRDTIVSTWHFVASMSPEAAEIVPFNRLFDWFCNGTNAYGPVWEHMLEYWHASLRWPEKVLFLKYEDLKKDTASNLRKLAEFMGCSFSEEEIKVGVVEEIVKLCSIEHLSSLEVNKTGVRGKEIGFHLKNSSFFRKGKVGDWVEHLTPEMARRIDRLMKEKLEGSGLSFLDSTYDDVEYAMQPQPLPVAHKKPS